MEKLKIKLLLIQYENELKSNNLEHLKDYIAANVILSLLKSKPLWNICDISDKLNQITLNDLIYWSYKNEKETNYKIPTINQLNYIIEQKQKLLKEQSRPVGTNEEFAAAIWLKLMINSGLVGENQIITLSEYKLKDFITDPRLIKITRINNFSEINLIDFKIDNSEDELSANKTKVIK